MLVLSPNLIPAYNVTTNIKNKKILKKRLGTELHLYRVEYFMEKYIYDLNSPLSRVNMHK